MGKRLMGLGRFPGFPARAFARVESRAVRLTVFPVYGPIRYRKANATLQAELQKEADARRKLEQKEAEERRKLEQKEAEARTSRTQKGPPPSF